MTLYWFLLVVSSLAAAAIPVHEVDLARGAMASVMLISAWIMLAQIASSVAIRAVESGRDAVMVTRLLERQLDAFRWLGLGISLVCLVGFRLAAIVKSLPLLEDLMTLQAIIFIAPSIVLTASTWISEHRYGVAIGDLRPNGWKTIHLMSSTLIASGGWILVPVFAILISTDLINATGLFSEQHASAIASIMAIIGIPILLPMILAKAWRTTEAPAEAGLWVGDIFKTCHLRAIPVRVWNTNMRSYNAVVAGFFPRMRSIILTDRLLEDLRRPQLALVVLHEVAHVKRRHVWIRLLSMAPAWIIAAALSAFLPQSATFTIATNVFAIVATLLMLRFIAHATEFDADQWACKNSLQISDLGCRPIDLSEAVQRYCETLRYVTRQEGLPSKASWLHPSINSRCDRLIRWAATSEKPEWSTSRSLAC